LCIIFGKLTDIISSLFLINWSSLQNNPIFLNENTLEDSTNESKINYEKSVLKIGVNSLTNERVIKNSKWNLLKCLLLIKIKN
jgi:hypothetical protein